jgi:hypothetical protein
MQFNRLAQFVRLQLMTTLVSYFFYNLAAFISIGQSHIGIEIVLKRRTKGTTHNISLK